jgi:hypothetical protein
LTKECFVRSEVKKSFGVNIAGKNTHNFTSINCTFMKTEILAVELAEQLLLNKVS